MDDANTKTWFLQARHDDFAYVTHKGLPKLNYSVCSSDNMKDLHSFLSEKSLWDGLRETDIDTINYLLREPVWQIAPASKAQLTESAVLNYTDDVIALGFVGQGKVIQLTTKRFSIFINVFTNSELQNMKVYSTRVFYDIKII